MAEGKVKKKKFNKWVCHVSTVYTSPPAPEKGVDERPENPDHKECCQVLWLLVKSWTSPRGCMSEMGKQNLNITHHKLIIIT